MAGSWRSQSQAMVSFRLVSTMVVFVRQHCIASIQVPASLCVCVLLLVCRWQGGR